jgi:hypothetical protein
MLFGFVVLILSGSSDVGLISLSSSFYLFGIPIILLWTSPYRKETISVLLLAVPVCFALGIVGGIVPEGSLIRSWTALMAVAFSYALSRCETSGTSYYGKIRERYTMYMETNGPNHN